MKSLRAAVLLICIWSEGFSATPFRFANYFGDHMILQRDHSNVIWGYGEVGQQVQLEFDSKVYRVYIDSSGRWQVTIPKKKAGGPYRIEVQSGGEKLAINDLLFGDLWVCSGQSNMAFGFSGVENYKEESKDVDFPMIRQLLVERGGAAFPQDDILGGKWAIANKETIASFTAVGFYFAKRIHRSTNVPIGLINSSWGGTPIEPFIPRAYFSDFEDIKQQVDRIDGEDFIEKTKTKNQQIRDEWTQKYYAFSTYINRDKEINCVDTFFLNKNWLPVKSTTFLEEQGVPVQVGISWLKKTIHLTEQQVEDIESINLGQISSVNTCFVNGRFVGTQLHPYVTTRYDLKEGVLHEGKNDIILCVYNENLTTGFKPNYETFFNSAGSGRLPIDSVWMFKPGRSEGYKELGSMGPGPEFVNSYPTLVFNAMIAPLQRLNVKGVLWYQGEANRRFQQCWNYEKMLTNLIGSWRAYLGNENLPFYVVQLPNYGPLRTEPMMSAWNIVQESQWKVSERLHNVGVAVTNDVGDSDDIHPSDKKTVADRLAAMALKRTYRKRLTDMGPLSKKVSIRGDEVIITFRNVGSGLVSRGADGRVNGFAVCGGDGSFHRADAVIKGKKVIVTSRLVKSPREVRYAMESSPMFLDLYNKEGFPAVPFRTDAFTEIIEL